MSQSEGAGGAEGIARLERLLARTRKHGTKANRQLFRAMSRDLELSARRLAKAEGRAERAEQRAERAEAELAAVRESATWKAGRVVTAVPSRLRRRRG